MKLEKKGFEKDGSGFAKLIPEESEDLWHLYNLVLPGDTVTALTWRKVQKVGAVGSVSTEVKKFQISIQVTNVDYDPAGDCIRFAGKNCEENQWVKIGAYHTVETEINNRIEIAKERWDFMFLRSLDEATDVHKTAEVAVVLIEAGVANFHLLTALLAKTVHRVTVQLPKKRISTTGYDKAVVRFYDQVYAGVKDHIDLDKIKCVVLAGPGFVKDDFMAYMLLKATQTDDKRVLQKKSMFVLARTSCVHKQGLNELLADEQVQKSMTNTKAGEHERALNNFYQMVKVEPERVTYGPKPVVIAVEKGAVHTLMVVDYIFRSTNLAERNRYVQMIETVKESGATVHVFSSQHVSGEQLKGLGGVAAVLRFPVPELEDVDSEEDFSDGGGDGGEPGGGDDDDDDDGSDDDYAAFT